MKKLLDFYVHSQMHVSLIAVILYFLYAHFFSFPYDSVYGLFVLFSTLSYYLFLRIIHLDQQRECVRQWYGKYFKEIIFFFLISSFISIYIYFFKLPTRIKWRLLPFILLAFLYNLRDSYGKIFSLRNIGYIKILLISWIWAGMVFLLPAMETDLPVPAIILFLLYVLFFIFLWTMPFDIRDLSLDPASLQTVPQIFKKKTALVTLMLIVIFEAFTWFLVLRYQLDKTLGILFILAALFLYWATVKSCRQEKNYYFTAFWVEGLPGMLLVGYLLIKSLL